MNVVDDDVGLVNWRGFTLLLKILWTKLDDDGIEADGGRMPPWQ